MFGANRLGDRVLSTCNGVPPGPFYKGSTDTFIDNLPAIRLGDPAVPGVAIKGSTTVFINNLPAVRIVDLVSCGVIAQCSTTTFYG